MCVCVFVCAGIDVESVVVLDVLLLERCVVVFFNKNNNHNNDSLYKYRYKIFYLK